MITIILTCYKQEKYIEETILSVISQSFKGRELLIGDDSPDDNCRNIISKYVKKYPDKIRARHHNPNKGIVNNMQFLIEQRNKKSEYVAFLEGDDCLFPEYLEKKLEIFEKYTNVQLVYNELTTIDDNSKIIEKKYLKHRVKKFYKEGKIDYEILINEILYASRSTLMIKAEILNKYNIYPEFLGTKTLISDIFFFNQIAHNFEIYGIERPLIYYRIHNDSTSGETKGTIKLYLEWIEYHKYLYEQGLISKKSYKSGLNKRYLLISMLTLKQCLKIGIFTTIKSFFKTLNLATKIRIKNKFYNKKNTINKK